MGLCLRNLWRVACLLLFLPAGRAAALQLNEDRLPPLPEPVASPAVGILDGKIAVAGGVRPAWRGGGAAGISRAVYVFHGDTDEWRQVGELPLGRHQATAVSVDASLWLVGGIEYSGSADTVLVLGMQNGLLTVDPESVPPLPMACEMVSAAPLNGTLYVSGVRAGRAYFWALGTTAPDQVWRELTHPLENVLEHSLAAHDGSLYLREFDRFLVYTPEGGWVQRAPGRPFPGAGVVFGQSHLLYFGMVGGEAYHTITRTWAPFATEVAFGAGVVTWEGARDGIPCVAVVGGRDRDGEPIDTVRILRPAPAENRFGWPDYSALAVYFVALVAMGAYFTRRETDTDAFFLGKRRVPWWAVGISIFGTSISAITYLSIPAMAYATNWIYILGNIGTVAMAPIVAVWYLPKFRAEPIVTPYEYLERRFNLGVRIYGSLTFALYQMGRMSIVLLLPAITLSAATGLPVTHSVLAMGLLATLYTVLGGIEAVIWTDVLQAIVLLLGAGAALVLALGEFGAAWTTQMVEAWNVGKFHTIDWSWDLTTTCVWVVVIGNLFGMAYPSTADQTVVQRYLSTATEKEAARAAYTNALLTIPAALIFYSLGTALWLHFRANPGQLDPLLPNDAVLPLFIVNEMPAGLRGILIAGVFAAAMSSLDSSMNSLAAVCVHDYALRFRPWTTEAGALRLARGLTILFGALGTGTALLLARFDTISLLNEFLRLLGLVGGGLAGVMALGVFTSRANGTGALVGAAVSAGLLFYVSTSTPLHFFLHGMIGFLAAFGVGYGVSVIVLRR